MAVFEWELKRLLQLNFTPSGICDMFPPRKTESSFVPLPRSLSGLFPFYLKFLLLPLEHFISSLLGSLTSYGPALPPRSGCFNMLHYLRLIFSDKGNNHFTRCSLQATLRSFAWEMSAVKPVLKDYQLIMRAVLSSSSVIAYSRHV